MGTETKGSKSKHFHTLTLGKEPADGLFSADGGSMASRSSSSSPSSGGGAFSMASSGAGPSSVASSGTGPSSRASSGRGVGHLPQVAADDVL